MIAKGIRCDISTRAHRANHNGDFRLHIAVDISKSHRFPAFRSGGVSIRTKIIGWKAGSSS